MSTMKGVVVEAVGSPYKVVTDLKVPDLSSDQILVKSISTAINPVYVLAVQPTQLILLYSQNRMIFSELTLSSS